MEAEDETDASLDKDENTMTDSEVKELSYSLEETDASEQLSMSNNEVRNGMEVQTNSAGMEDILSRNDKPNSPTEAQNDRDNEDPEPMVTDKEGEEEMQVSQNSDGTEGLDTEENHELEKNNIAETLCSTALQASQEKIEKTIENEHDTRTENSKRKDSETFADEMDGDAYILQGQTDKDETSHGKEHAAEDDDILNFEENENIDLSNTQSESQITDFPKIDAVSEENQEIASLKDEEQINEAQDYKERSHSPETGFFTESVEEAITETDENISTEEKVSLNDDPETTAGIVNDSELTAHEVYTSENRSGITDAADEENDDEHMDVVDKQNEESVTPDTSGELKDSDALGNELDTAEESEKPDGEICDQGLKTPYMLDDPHNDDKVHETVNEQFEGSTVNEIAHKSANMTEDIEPDTVDDDGDRLYKSDEEPQKIDLSDKLGIEETSSDVGSEEKSEKCERMISDDKASQLLDEAVDKGPKTPDILKNSHSDDETDTAVDTVHESLSEQFEGSADNESTHKLDDMTEDIDLETDDADKVDGIVEEPKTSDVPDKLVDGNELGSEINNEKEPEILEEVSCDMRDSLQSEGVIKKGLESFEVLDGPDNVDASYNTVGMAHASLNEAGEVGADSDTQNKVDEKTANKDTHSQDILDEISDSLIDKINDTTEQETEEGADILENHDDDRVGQSMADAATEEPKIADSQEVVGDDSEHQQEVNSILEDEETDSVSFEDVATKVNPDYLLDLGKSLERLRMRDQLCDITINTKDTKFRAHKLILCAASPVLQNLMKGKEFFKEIDIPSDISSAAVEVFIHYIYTGELLLKAKEMTDLEKLMKEYGMESLKSDFMKNAGSPSVKPSAKSVNTKTRITGLEAVTVDVSNKPKAQTSSSKISVEKSSRNKSDILARLKELSAQKSSEVDTDSRLLESDDDDCGDMDYDEHSDDENDMLRDSEINSGSAGIVKAEPKSFNLNTGYANQSAVSLKKEIGCVPESRRERVGDTQRAHQVLKDILSTPVKKDKSCNVKVSVEKLPPTINPNVTVVVSEDEDIADSQIEFVAEKCDDSQNNQSGFTKREFTLEEKEQIALEAKRYGTTQTAKARNIPLPDVLSWMTFFGLRKASDNVTQKYGKQVNHEAELSIVRWIVQQQEVNGNVNLDAMRNYALAVYRQSQPNFVASKTWLANFFKRNISVLQGTNFIHGGDEGSEDTGSEPVPVKLTQIPNLVDPALASIESQISEHQAAMSSHPSSQSLEDMDISSSSHTNELLGDTETSQQEFDSSHTSGVEKISPRSGLLEDLSSIYNSVTASEGSDLGGISKELMAKIRSKPIVIGTAVMFDAKTERRLAEWLVERQQKDGYVYRDDFVDYAKSVHKGNKRFQASKGWIQLFMRRNSVKMPLLKQVVFKSKFKTYYTDEEKHAIVQQARKLGVPHVAKMLGINSGVIHSWKMGMDAEDRKKGGPRNYEKVTRSVTRAFPSVSKEVDEIIDNSLKERIKASIDIESKRKASTNPNRGPDPELEKEAIDRIKQAEIVRYQDIKKICLEVYSKKRPEFQASRSWVLKFVNTHLEGIEGIEVLKSWFDYPEKNQIKLRYADKMNILEEEKIHGVEKVANMKNISGGTIRFWKKYPPSPEDDEPDVQNDDASEGKSKKIRTDEYEYVPSKYHPGRKVRRRVVIGEAVMFTPEMELNLVQWIHDHLLPDNSVYTDDFREYAKSIYTGNKLFSATSTWMSKFVRRNPVLRDVKFISKYKRYFTDEEKYAAVMEARRFGTSYVAKKLNADSGLINSWKIKFARYSAKKMARLKQSAQLDRLSLQNITSEKEKLPSVQPHDIDNPDLSLEEIEKEVGSGLHSYKGEIPVFEREIVQLILDEDKEKGGVTYEDISRLCRSVYERTRPHFKASQNWTRDFIKRHEEALKDINIENRKKMFIDDDEPLNHSTSRLYKRHGNEPVDVSPVLKKIMGKKPILLGQSRTLEPKMERKLVQWMIQKQADDGYVFMDEFNDYAKSLYRGSKKFAATQAWRIKFFRRNKAALRHVKLESKFRKQFTREEKMAIVAEARRLGIGHVARKLDVNSSLIYSWGFGKSPQLSQDEIANERIEQDVGKGLYCQRGSVPTLEKDIVRLIHEKQNQEGSVSYDDISKICRDVYQETRPSFKASYNWTMDFIKRHKEELKGVDIENMKKVYYENGDEEQPGLESFISTLNQNMDTDISDSMVQIENLEQGQDIDFHAHSFEESNLDLNDILASATGVQVKQEILEDTSADHEADSTLGSSILERIRASKPDIVAQPKTFDIEVEKKMVKWLVERQARDAYVFTDDFIEYAKSLYSGSDPFSGSQTWRKNFLRRHKDEVKDIIFRSKHVNTYTETERQMVVEEARKLGIAHVAKMCGLDHRLVWSWKVKADQENKAKQNAFWKGPKKTTSVVSKPVNVKQTNVNPVLEDEEPLGDAFRGVVPEFEDRIIKMIIEQQNKEGSISYDEISEISRNIYQETRPNFKAGYGWIKNFLQRHKNKLKNIDIENMKKLYLPDDDRFVPASGQNIRDLSCIGSTSQATLGSTNLGSAETSQVVGSEKDGNTLASLQRIMAKKPIVLGVPKSFNIKTEKKLVQWLLEQQAEQGYAFIDEFKDFASSLYTGDKKFAATNAWRTQFFRRNHAALKHVKLVSKFRKTFTEEEKLAIVKEAKRLGVGHVSRQLDIGHGNINVWMRELEAKGRCSSNTEEELIQPEPSSSPYTGLKDKRNESTDRRSSSDSRQTSRERSNTTEDDIGESETGSGLFSARGIVPVFENQIIDEILEYYRINESIKYDDISRISQNIYKETRPTFKASHNWIKDFMSRHAEKLSHIIIQNAREFLTQREKREVIAEVEKHGINYVSKVTNISTAQLLAWKEQLQNAAPAVPYTPSTPVQTPTRLETTVDFSPSNKDSDKIPGVRARKYSIEEKKMYVAECEKHGIAYVSSKFNVPKTNLGRWTKELKTQNENNAVPDSRSTVVPAFGNYQPELDSKIVDWVLNREKEISIVLVTHLLDFAQATIVESTPSFVASEEWLTNFLSRHTDKFKNVKFRYPEEVTKNKLGFTQEQKDKLCLISNTRPVVEVATLAGIYPATLYDWRKHYKRRQMKAASASSEQKISTELVVPKTEPEEPDVKSKMQEKLARIEGKYNAIQKQAIADEARKDGTTSTAKKHSIPLPLVLKWMKMFPETVPTASEMTPKSGSERKSKSARRSTSTPKSPSGSKAKETKKDSPLKVKLPLVTPKQAYSSKAVTPEERRKIIKEYRKEGATAVYNRTGIPKSTLYHWNKSFGSLEEEDDDDKSDTNKQPKKGARSSKSSTPDIKVKKEVIDIDSFTTEQRKEIALETKSLGFEETAKKRGLPTAVVIEWMGLYLNQSPTTTDNALPSATARNSLKPAPPRREYTEEERINIAGQALDIGIKETANLTGIHLSNVRRWTEMYKKKLKDRQYKVDKKGKGSQSTQDKNEKKHKLIQGIMKDTSGTQKSSKENSALVSLNTQNEDETTSKPVEAFTFEYKLRVLQAADEMGIRNASQKFKVDAALIYEWRKIYDYAEVSNPAVAARSATVTSATSEKLKTSTPAKTSSTPSSTVSRNSSELSATRSSGVNEFDSIVISDDEGSCSPCSNHSWQSDDLNLETPRKRKSDFGETDLNPSAKKGRVELNESFGVEDSVRSDVIDFAYTVEQKQSIVKESNMYGLEKVSKMTNIPASLIMAWKAQFPNLLSVKTEKM